MTASSTATSRLPVAIRFSNGRDRPFILNSWVKSYKKRVVRDADDLEAYRAYISGQNTLSSNLLSQSNSLVACHESDQDQIFGYIVYERPSTVHYIYVKVPFRGLGIAKRLYLEAIEDHTRPVTASHWAPRIDGYKARGLNIQYSPYGGQ